jgi:uncharacterized protein YhhL (DUF1145 family)
MSVATLQRAKTVLNVVWVVLAVSFVLPASPLVGALRLAFVLMLAAHALEFLFFQRTLARLGGSMGQHFVQVLLYGLFHLQLAKARAGEGPARS